MRCSGLRCYRQRANTIQLHCTRRPSNALSQWLAGRRGRHRVLGDISHLYVRMPGYQHLNLSNRLPDQGDQELCPSLCLCCFRYLKILAYPYTHNVSNHVSIGHQGTGDRLEMDIRHIMERLITGCALTTYVGPGMQSSQRILA